MEINITTKQEDARCILNTYIIFTYPDYLYLSICAMDTQNDGYISFMVPSPSDRKFVETLEIQSMNCDIYSYILVYAMDGSK